MMTGGLLGGALGAYLLTKSSQGQEEMMDSSMEKTSGMARDTARVIGRSASKVGSRVVKVGESAMGAIRQDKVRS